MVQRDAKMTGNCGRTTSEKDIVLSESEDEDLKWGKGERGRQIVQAQTTIDFEADFVSLVPPKRTQSESIEDDWQQIPREKVP